MTRKTAITLAKTILLAVRQAADAGADVPDSQVLAAVQAAGLEVTAAAPNVPEGQ